MRVSQLIEILRRDLDDNGDRNTYYLSGDNAYEITYLGAGTSSEDTHFWLTADERLKLEPGETEDDFRAPAYKASLVLIK